MSGAPQPGGPVPPPPPPGGDQPRPEPERVTAGTIEADPRIMEWCLANGFSGSTPDSAVRWLRRQDGREDALAEWLAQAAPGEAPKAEAAPAEPLGAADRDQVANMLALMIHEPVCARMRKLKRKPPPVELAQHVGQQGVRLLEKYGLLTADVGPEISLALALGVYALAVWKAPPMETATPTETDAGA